MPLTSIASSPIRAPTFLWTTDLTIAAIVLLGAALAVTGVWVYATLRGRALRRMHEGAGTPLARTAKLNRLAAAITGIALTGVVVVLAWRLFLNLR